MNPRLTAIIVAALIPVLGLFDVFLALDGGNAATISAVMLTLSFRHPEVAWNVAYSFGMFLTHVFIPSGATEAPANAEIVSRFIIGTSPTFAVCAMILFAEPVHGVPSHVTEPRYQVIMALKMLGSLIAGGLVGRFWLAQHPLVGVHV